MMGLLLLLALGLGLYASFLIASTYSTLRFPRRRTYSWAVSRGVPGDPGELTPALAFRRFGFESRGRRLIAWDIDGNCPTGPVAVLTHGWSDSKVGALARVSALAPMCSRIVAWDLPGHGESPGACELGMREGEDLVALLESLDGPGSARIVLFGWSLGAGVSLVAGNQWQNRDRLAGVIAEAPYRLVETPARNVMRAQRSPWRLNLPIAIWLIRRRAGVSAGALAQFDRAGWARELPCPLLVLYGTDDVVCPLEDARAIANAKAGGMLVEIEGARHNDVWARPGTRERAIDAVRQFLANPDQATGVGCSS
ncbi:MAG: alpha/beta hydrolase [Phycisphaerae bacterium]|nr:alpha/beta hydrolase [Phycisphaerae bacterium]